MHVAIRADGGSDIGYGHLVRTGALAEELLQRGHEVSYATTTPSNVVEVCPAGVDTFTLGSRRDPTAFTQWVKENVDIAVVDSYLADEDYQRSVQNAASLVLISDDTRHSVCADIVVNGNLYAPSLNYDVIGTEPRWCLGPRYLLLRRAITKLSGSDPPQREKLERALITMGGSDIANLTPTVIKAFEGLDLHVDAIVGPGFSSDQEREVRDAAKKTSIDIEVKRNPDDLPKRMFNADLAVSTASTTTYELLALGTPIVSYPAVDNQEPIAAALRELDASTVLERGADEAAFRRAIREYVSDTYLRRKRQELGCTLVDGGGAKRINTEVISLINEDLGT